MIGISIDRYEILEELGHGGMSVVYRGQDRALERDVAIKVLHEHLARRVDNRQRFHREAKAIARLRHPNILEVYDYSAEDDERAFIVMEYVAGRNLRQFVEERGPSPPEIAVLIVLQLCEALAHAHERGIVHRDIKPENVMVAADGSIKLMDFGIAHVFDQETMTQTGSLLGSPGHMAPEMIEGGGSDERSDIFSLGTVLYWLCLGKLPFVGTNTPQVLRRVLEGSYEEASVADPRVGAPLSRLMARAMACAPADRFESVAAMGQALARHVDDHLGPVRAGALEGYLADPKAARVQLEAQLVERLTAMGRRAMAARDLRGALDALNRVLAYEPGHPEVERLLRKVQTRARMGTGLLAAVVVVAVCGVGLALWVHIGEQRQRQQAGDRAATVVGAAAASAARAQASASGARGTVALALARAQGLVEERHNAQLAEANVAAQEVASDVERSASAVVGAVAARARSARAAAARPPALIRRLPVVAPDDGESTSSLPDLGSPPPAERFRYRFRITPASARLRIDKKVYTPLEAFAGIPLPLGRYTVQVFGQTIKPQVPELLEVQGPQQDDVREIEAHWRDGLIEVRADRPSLVYVDGEPHPRLKLEANRKGIIAIPFGRGSNPARRTVELRVHNQDDMKEARLTPVPVRAGDRTPVTITF